MFFLLFLFSRQIISFECAGAFRFQGEGKFDDGRFVLFSQDRETVVSFVFAYPVFPWDLTLKRLVRFNSIIQGIQCIFRIRGSETINGSISRFGNQLADKRILCDWQLRRSALLLMKHRLEKMRISILDASTRATINRNLPCPDNSSDIITSIPTGFRICLLHTYLSGKIAVLNNLVVKHHQSGTTDNGRICEVRGQLALFHTAVDDISIRIVANKPGRTGVYPAIIFCVFTVECTIDHEISQSRSRSTRRA